MYQVYIPRPTLESSGLPLADIFRIETSVSPYHEERIQGKLCACGVLDGINVSV
jgi:hypothetical protein